MGTTKITFADGFHLAGAAQEEELRSCEGSVAWGASPWNTGEKELGAYPILHEVMISWNGCRVAVYLPPIGVRRGINPRPTTGMSRIVTPK